eukprot:9282469-Pyramimonas_sp.AAC.1
MLREDLLRGRGSLARCQDAGSLAAPPPELQPHGLQAPAASLAGAPRVVQVVPWPLAEARGARSVGLMNALVPLGRRDMALFVLI